MQFGSPAHIAESWLLRTGTAPERIEALTRVRAENGIEYPFILKPDVGQRGAGVKLIRDGKGARECLLACEALMVVQRYAAGPFEAGVFYYRFPGEEKGRVFAITEKVFPEVEGDGQSTLEELIWQDDRARFVADRYLARLGDRRTEILPVGTTVKLVEAGNHAQGCIFRDGARWLTPELEDRIDEISRKVDGFYIGRYDIRFASEADFRSGKEFQIIELNGASSEATSIYDSRNSIVSAYRTLFRQWELVFAIGAANRQKGVPSLGLSELLQAWKANRRLVAAYPIAD